MNNGKATFAEAIKEALEEELTLNPDLLIIGEAILGADATEQTTPDAIHEKFPHRVFNHLPLIEDMLGGIGLGMSLKGMQPIIQLDYSTFLTLILSDIHRIGAWRYRMFEKTGPGIVFRVACDGYAKKGAELGTSLLGTVFHMPNIRIIIPSQPYYAKGLLKAAIRSGEPAIFFEHKKLYETTDGPEIPREDYTLPLECSPVLRHGQDITLVAWGYTSHLALQAAEILAQNGIQTEVISPQTLHPLDMKTIFTSIRKTRCIIIVEEDMLRGGIGAELCARIAEQYSGCQVSRIAAKNFPLPFGKKIEEQLLPSVSEIVATCQKMLKQKPWRLW